MDLPSYVKQMSRKQQSWRYWTSCHERMSPERRKTMWGQPCVSRSNCLKTVSRQGLTEGHTRGARWTELRQSRVWKDQGSRSREPRATQAESLNFCTKPPSSTQQRTEQRICRRTLPMTREKAIQKDWVPVACDNHPGIQPIPGRVNLKTWSGVQSSVF